MIAIDFFEKFQQKRIQKTKASPVVARIYLHKIIKLILIVYKSIHINQLL